VPVSRAFGLTKHLLIETGEIEGIPFKSGLDQMSCVNTAALLEVILLTGETVWFKALWNPAPVMSELRDDRQAPACTSRQVLDAQSMTNAWFCAIMTRKFIRFIRNLLSSLPYASPDLVVPSLLVHCCVMAVLPMLLPGPSPLLVYIGIRVGTYVSLCNSAFKYGLRSLQLLAGHFRVLSPGAFQALLCNQLQATAPKCPCILPRRHNLTTNPHDCQRT
jgi:hypothetical protein